MGRRAKQRHPSSLVLAFGWKLLGMGSALLLMSWVLGRSGPATQVAAQTLGAIAPYPLAIGALVTVVGWALRPRPEAPSTARKPPASEWYPADSTDFAPRDTQIDGAGGRDAPASTLETRIRSGRRPPATAWSRQVFEDIEWRRFESLCAQLFAQAGFEARTQSHGADGGVDIWLHSRNAEGPVAVVQCKHWQGKPVGVKELREFFGVMASRKVARGTYATTSTFTEDAANFARDNGIHLLDGEGLLALIAKRTPEQQQALLDHAYEGEYWRPTCASCGAPMVERSPRKGGAPFWGCAGYPKCRNTLPMRQA